MMAMMLSWVGGLVAVALPHMVWTYALCHMTKASFFSQWAVKFSITVLLLTLAMRLLSTLSLLHDAFLLSGVGVALIVNTVWFWRWSPLSARAK